MKSRVIFKGKRYVVILLEEPVEKLIEQGFVMQRDNKYYDNEGREVIMVTSHFKSHPFMITSANLPPCNMPYLYKTLPGGYTAGSITYMKDGVLWTNWHVADVCDTACSAYRSYNVEWLEHYKPKIYNTWVFILLTLLQKLGIDLIKKSKYDFSIGKSQAPPSDIYTSVPDLIYTAGTCNGDTCFGLSLQIPLLNYDNFNPVGKRYNMKCTLWQFETSGKILDEGVGVVYYNTGFAVFEPVYLMSFDGKPGIPGCSGSPVWVEK